MITREELWMLSQRLTTSARAILSRTVPVALDTAGHVADFYRSARAYVRGLRKMWLFLTEVIGVILVTVGISFWSIPSALIIGGLVLIAVIEVRPVPTPKFPEIPVPTEALRLQAERAAEAINNERFGLAMIDPKAFEKLSTEDCEKIITFARTIGAKRT